MTRGFTLLETLIALVIASITALVLLESLTAIARTTARVDEAAGDALRHEFTTTATEDALAAAIADYLDSEGAFVGEARRLHGVTKRPILAPYGAPRPFAMQIVEDPDGVRLRYQEQAPSPDEEDSAPWIDVLRLEGEDIRFLYAYRSLDALYAGEPPVRSETWPPEEPLNPFYDYFRPPPDLVLIVNAEGAVLWAVASDGWQAPPLRPSDLEEVL